MYETHWVELVRQWREQPLQWRVKVQDEVLNGRGVPPPIRAKLWLEASGAAAKRERHPDAYREYVAQSRKLYQARDPTFCPVELQIRKDVQRTFPLFLRKLGRNSSSRPASLGSKQQNSHPSSKQNSSSSSTHHSRNQNAGNQHEQLDEKQQGEKREEEIEKEWRPHERSLYNVLCAISICVEKVTYHQGLNYVTAVLLICMRDSAQHEQEMPVNSEKGHSAKQTQADAFNELNGNDKIMIEERESWEQTEESAFWILFSLLEDYHLSGLYEHKSSFLQQYMDQFDLLVRRFLPRLHHHFEIKLQPGFPVVLFSMEWFTTLYSYSLRLDCVYLIWDLFLVARLDEALFVSGLGILFHISESLMKVNSFEEMVDKFKTLVGSIRAKHLKQSIGTVVQRIVPSVLIPPGRSTLAAIEREMHDSSNTLNTTQYDATAFIHAVRIGDARTALLEAQKYRFPVGLVEQALLRACFLGFAAVVRVLLSCCDPSIRHSLNHVEGLSPLHVAALMGHPTVARVLLDAGVDRSLRCYSEILSPFFGKGQQRNDGYTAHDLAQAIVDFTCKEDGQRKTSAVLMVLEGDVCLGCGRLLQRRVNSKGKSAWANLWDSILPDWEQAVPRAQTNESEWVGGDYCSDCQTRRRQASEEKILLDRPLGPHAWHCRYCRVITLGSRTVRCKRCQASFCAPCAFTRRRLLPKYKNPVDVCQNCHHFLRSCPCHYNGERAKCYDVVCEHSPIDYAIECLSVKVTPDPDETVHFCSCNQCLKRRYALKAPLQFSLAAKYDPDLVLFPFQEAILHGYWGYSDQSILSVNDNTAKTEVLKLIQQVEDFAMSRMQLSSNSSDKQHELTTATEGESNGLKEKKGTGNRFRDYRAELVDFYTMWNPSQLTKVDRLLEKYKGKEEHLLADLHKMYASN